MTTELENSPIVININNTPKVVEKSNKLEHINRPKIQPIYQPEYICPFNSEPLITRDIHVPINNVKTVNVRLYIIVFITISILVIMFYVKTLLIKR